MKTPWTRCLSLVLMMFLVVSAVSVSITGCSNSPTNQAIEQRTLGVVGDAAAGAMKTAAQMLKDGRITGDQWRTVAAFYNERFQPVYNTALTASQMNPNSIASPDLVSLATQLSNLVLQLQK